MGERGGRAGGRRRAGEGPTRVRAPFSHVPHLQGEVPFFWGDSWAPPGFRALMKVRDGGGVYGASAQRRRAAFQP